MNWATFSIEYFSTSTSMEAGVDTKNTHRLWSSSSELLQQWDHRVIFCSFLLPQKDQFIMSEIV